MLLPLSYQGLFGGQMPYINYVCGTCMQKLITFGLFNTLGPRGWDKPSSIPIWSQKFCGNLFYVPPVTTKSDTYCTIKHLPHKNQLKISNEELLCPHLFVVFDDEKKVATIIISFISSSFVPSLISFSDCRFYYFTFSFQIKWK